MALTEIRNVGSRVGFREHVKLKRQLTCPSPTHNSRGVTDSKQFLNPAIKMLGVL